MAFNV